MNKKKKNSTCTFSKVCSGLIDFQRTDMCTETRRTRAWSDPQMYTHLAFVPGVVVALQREPAMLEIVVMQGLVCVLSLWYHRNYEHECGMAKIEHTFAHALFVYGWIQMLRSPGFWIFLANMACACVTLNNFRSLNINEECECGS